MACVLFFQLNPLADLRRKRIHVWWFAPVQDAVKLSDRDSPECCEPFPDRMVQ